VKRRPSAIAPGRLVFAVSFFESFESKGNLPDIQFPQGHRFPQTGIQQTLKGSLTLLEKLLYSQAVRLVLRVRGRSRFNRALSGLGVRPVTNTG
jgi:hypothetical protein